MALMRLRRSLVIGMFGGRGAMAKTPDAATSRVSGAKNALFVCAASMPAARSGKGMAMRVTLAA